MSDYLPPRDPDYWAAMQLPEKDKDIQKPPSQILYNAATAGNSFALNALLQSANVNINLTPDPTTSLSSPELVQVTDAWKPVDEKFDRLKQRARRLEGCAWDDAQELQDKKQHAFKIRANLEFAAGAAERSGRGTDMDGVKRWLEVYKAAVENFEVTVDRVADLMPPDLNELYVRPGVFSIMEDKLVSEGAAVLMMYGGPGLGKSALGRQLWQKAVEDGRLHKQFPHGVIHIEFGRGPEEELPQKEHLLRKLEELEMKLDKEAHKEAASRQTQNTTADALAAEILEARVGRVLAALRQLLADGKRRLLILDDVWPAQARMLRAGGLLSSTFKGKCVVLSRENMARVIEGGAEEIKLQNEASICEAILAAHAYGNKDESELEPEHKAWGKLLLDRCGSQPLMIRLIASMLRDEMHERGRDASVWRMVHESLEGRLSALQTDDPGGTDAISDYYCNPMAAYELSASAVDADCKRMLRMMTLFPHSQRIPAGALLAVWHGSTGSKAGFSRALRILQRKCILDVLAHNTPTGTDDVRMHALLHMYLIRFTSPSPSSVLSPPTVPIWTRVKMLWTGLQDAEAICTPSTAAHSALALYGDTHVAAASRSHLRALMRLVHVDLKSDWWRQCGVFECSPESVACILQLANDLELSGIEAAAQQLLVSAATQCVWQTLLPTVAKLLTHSNTAIAALAFIAGATPDLPPQEAWMPEYSSAILRLIATCGDDRAALNTLHTMGIMVSNLGRNKDALMVVECVFAARARLLGAEHPDALASMNNVVLFLHNVGRNHDALVMAERLLGILERVIGAEHPKTLKCMSNVAVFLGAVGRSDDALEMAERVLGIRERVIGAEHPDTLTSMHNVASYLGDVGRYDDALEMAEQVLAIMERVIGAEHPSTLTCMSNVPLYLGAVGRNHDALGMAERVVGIRERVIGAEHPDTLVSMSNVAALLDVVGRNHDSLVMAEQVLVIMERVIGAEHPKTLKCMSNVAVYLSAVGRSDDALEMAERVLGIRERVIGAEHPDTLTSMHNMATFLGDVGRYDDALEMAERVLAIQERVIGAEHPDTLTSMHNVASCLDHVGRNDDALVMAEQVLAIMQRVIGAEHPKTLTCMHNVAVYLGSVGRKHDALEMAQRALGIRERVIGVEHPHTLASMSNVASCLGAVGRNDDALEMAERVLAIKERVIGAEHPDTLTSMSNVASCLGDVGRNDDALEMAERVLGIRERVIGAEHPNTLVSMSNVAALLDVIGRNNDALVMAERVRAIRGSH